jgi:hypothetical protein
VIKSTELAALGLRVVGNKAVRVTPTEAPKRAPLARGMNKTERRYANHLDMLKRQGVVLWWAFEAVKLKLAPNTHYTPDFLVLRPGGFEFHEVKGFWRDDARVKIKVAAVMFPIPFLAVRWAKGWQYEVFSVMDEIVRAANNQPGERDDVPDQQPASPAAPRPCRKRAG